MICGIYVTFEQSTGGDERSRSGGFSVLNLNGWLINQASPCACCLRLVSLLKKEMMSVLGGWIAGRSCCHCGDSLRGCLPQQQVKSREQPRRSLSWCCS
jgi:hypothetical protein